MDLLGMRIVVPSTLAAGEPFAIKVRLLGQIHEIPCSGAWNDRKPRQRGPFNLNVARRIQFMDNCLPDWTGSLRVDGADALEGPGQITFDGVAQGAYPGDTRPIRSVGGFRWIRPGIHFVRLIDEASGLEAWSNPVRVSETPPAERIYWGDPHWQTIFSDGIRCPEELYAFARDEAFLDFGAISDHMEAVTDRQWDYFQAVTNDYDEPGRFVTLQGQEWTHHIAAKGAPGHRNIYYRGGGGPPLRCTDPDCDTLDKLWRKLDSLDGIEAVAIPHHPANVSMGVDWNQGWNAKYETAVEIYSVWGSSEKPESAGNTRPIRHCKGEMAGRHVIDALKRGYRFGFMGGGDVHDGRPGDALHDASYPREGRDCHMQEQGYTAVRVGALTRANVFDALRGRRTYAATMSRILLEADGAQARETGRLDLLAASEEGIREVVVVRNGEETECLQPRGNARIVDDAVNVPAMQPDEFCYLRVMTEQGNMAWSSPFWGTTTKESTR